MAGNPFYWTAREIGGVEPGRMCRLQFCNQPSDDRPQRRFRSVMLSQKLVSDTDNKIGDSPFKDQPSIIQPDTDFVTIWRVSKWIRKCSVSARPCPSDPDTRGGECFAPPKDGSRASPSGCRASQTRATANVQPDGKARL